MCNTAVKVGGELTCIFILFKLVVLLQVVANIAFTDYSLSVPKYAAFCCF